ncbi:MAG: hypothetical protein QGH49_21510 [SAR324 cluster bacterium]|jgi:hypothetical protein|nr:hypothetical protein [SAR324 cluster bacterium]|tara:strand:+ start:560 stop:994 length:435 start_codon:yes stop_codon:yes gene_type:complete
MLKHLKILVTISIILVIIGLKSLHAVPAFPGLLKISQPDGSVVEAYLKGDEYFSWWETQQGHVSVKNEQTGYLEYASINKINGKEELFRTGIRVSKVEEQARSQSSVPKLNRAVLGRIWTAKRRVHRENLMKILQQKKDFDNKQ